MENLHNIARARLMCRSVTVSVPLRMQPLLPDSQQLSTRLPSSGTSLAWEFGLEANAAIQADVRWKVLMAGRGDGGPERRREVLVTGS